MKILLISLFLPQEQACHAGGRYVLVADDPLAFAGAVLAILIDERLPPQLTAAGCDLPTKKAAP